MYTAFTEKFLKELFLKNLLIPSVLLSLGTFGSYILGFIREPIFGHAYGSSSLTDAYFSAFQISDLLFLVFITSALLGLVQPIFLQEKEKSSENGYKIFGVFFTALHSFFLLAIVLVFIFLEDIFSFLYPQTFERKPEELLFMGKIFLISNFIFGISNFVGTFSMAHKRFISTSLAPMLYNLGIIFGILFFSDLLGIYAAAYGVLFGSLMHLAVRLWEYFFFKERFSLNISFVHPLLKDLVFSMLLRLPIVATIPVVLVYFNTISGTQEGLYTIFRYTHNLQSAPVAIFGIAFATACFPIFSELFAKKKMNELHASLFQWLGKVLFWTVPASIGLVFFGTQILSLLYGIDAQNFAFLLPFLALAIPLESVNHIFTRYFNAQNKVWIPLFGHLFLALGVFFFLFVFSGNFSLEILLSASYLCGFVFQMLFYFFVQKNVNKPWGWSWEVFSAMFFLSLSAVFVSVFFENVWLKIFLGIPFVLFMFFLPLVFFWREKFLKKLREFL